MRTALTNGLVIDGVGGIIERGTVVIADNRIESVGPARHIHEVIGELTVVDVDGATILPGLINLHVHLQRRHLHRLSASSTFRVGAQMLEAQPDEVRMVWAIQNAWSELVEGVTTLRDAGSGGSLANKVRWAFASGVLNGPRLISSGEAIAMTGGHCTHYKNLGARPADGPEGVRVAVRDELAHGADWIKLMASSGLAGMPDHEHPGLSELTVDEMAAGVREAHARHARVMAHAFYPEAVQNSVEAGVDCIEHGTALDEQTVGLMARHRVCYVPTMSNMVEVAAREEVAGNLDTAEIMRQAAVYPHLDSVRMAHEAGLRIATGTDTLGQLNAEVELLHSAGLTRMECLQAATSVAADVLGMGSEIGALVPGLASDVIVVEGNPLDDLSALRKVCRVYKSGELVDPTWMVGPIAMAPSRPGLAASQALYRRPSSRVDHSQGVETSS